MTQDDPVSTVIQFAAARERALRAKHGLEAPAFLSPEEARAHQAKRRTYNAFDNIDGLLERTLAATQREGWPDGDLTVGLRIVLDKIRAFEDENVACLVLLLVLSADNLAEALDGSL
ncbi:hypothetical protein HW532_18350 [Kaustia mangrovi]|uniref:Uncharacterized protein n=1 Tax=Kaustia mangrovi TaxID=2593653 RepID=A0A7S8C6X1_9HYPH|nr:hypothetical protein [Kaustia mangrovi]QPC44484.1 hypothetical protein HW532_18350 [Kaustia mangrovi]